MGYIGHRMSERAANAYDEGKMPLSKWSKEDIISSYPEQYRNLLQKLSLKELRDNFLRYDSWHHTGKFFNKTDFYEPYNLDEYPDFINDRFNQIQEKKIEEMKNKKDRESFSKLTPQEQQAKFDEWNKQTWNDAFNKGNNEYYNYYKPYYENVFSDISGAKEWLEEMYNRHPSPSIKELKLFLRPKHIPKFIDINDARIKAYSSVDSPFDFSHHNVYEIGRKPNAEQYSNSASFFNKGEKRINLDKRIMEQWNGEVWEPLISKKTFKNPQSLSDNIINK